MLNARVFGNYIVALSGVLFIKLHMHDNPMKENGFTTQSVESVVRCSGQASKINKHTSIPNDSNQIKKIVTISNTQSIVFENVFFRSSFVHMKTITFDQFSLLQTLFFFRLQIQTLVELVSNINQVGQKETTSQTIAFIFFSLFFG